MELQKYIHTRNIAIFKSCTSSWSKIVNIDERISGENNYHTKSGQLRGREKTGSELNRW